MKNIIAEIAAERRRQIAIEGFHYGHDDTHKNGELAAAAACYAYPQKRVVQHHQIDRALPLGWPWHQTFWKPKERRRDLVRAAALIVAEIERLDRAAQPPEDGK